MRPATSWFLLPDLINLDLDIEGMTCTACSRRIEKNLNKVEGVHAYVDFATETAHVTMAPTITRDQLVQVVKDTGYDVGARRPDSDALKWRIIIGAVIALPVALIGMIPGWMPANWTLIAALATLPVATWVAWPFHSVAIKNLKQRTSTMDTLVSLGVTIAYLYSAAQLLAGGMESYFEVAAVVPTVVLFGRWLEVRTRRSATDSVRALLAAIPDNATVRRDGQQVTIPTAQVKTGETIVVATGQTIPVDAVVLEGRGLIDNSLITGESVPEEAGAGTAVAAGALNLGATLVLQATAVSANSRIARLTDRISNVFVPSVIATSAATYLGWLLIAHDPNRALSAAIAVLVIACPCALGIAVPMSLAVATSLGARRGIVIRHPDTLSLLGHIRRVVLDKTGTVTTGQLNVAASIAVNGSTTDAATATSYAAALERGSVHPVARAIADLDSRLTATNVTETAGSGVTGVVDGHLVEVNRRGAETFANPTETAAAIEGAGTRSIAIVSMENRAVLVLGLEDSIRPEAHAAIVELTEMGIEPVLLSGDQPSRVAAVAEATGIAKFFAGVTPEGKLEAVKQLKSEAAANQLTAMVGDGLNDVAALAAADVGIAMGSGTYATQSAAAITILDDDPRAIPFAIKLGRRTYSNIRQNLGWAFGYNVILIPVAAAGLLNPMLAGTAMAFSSISVVLNALRLRRA
jgi:P-type Cu+ transporter